MNWGRRKDVGLHVDQYLTITWLGSVNLFDLGRDRPGLVVDTRFMLLWDFN
jgi:hypothetical protein